MKLLDKMEISKRKNKINNLKVKDNKVNKKWILNQSKKANPKTITQKGN